MKIMPENKCCIRIFYLLPQKISLEKIPIQFDFFASKIENAPFLKVLAQAVLQGMYQKII